MMRRDFVASIISLLVLIVLGLTPLPGRIGELIMRVRKPVMSTREADAITAGYYEDLLDATSMRGSTPTGIVGSVAVARTEAPADWLRLQETDGVIWDADPYQRFTLRPGSRLLYKGALLDVNALGYRDLPFDVEPDPNKRRVAVVGASIAMGSGVPVGATFENLLERTLQERGEDVEVVNLSVAGYRGTQLVDVMLEQVPVLQPDAVVLVLNDLAVNPRWSHHLERLLFEGRDLKYPFLRDVVERAGIEPGMELSEITRRLVPFKDEVNAWWLSASVESARASGVALAILVLPQPATVEPFRKRVRGLHELLTGLGVPVISLYGAYDEEYDQAKLWLEPWDRHPNIEGHQLIHGALLDALEQRGDFRTVLLGDDVEQEDVNDE